MSFLNSKKLRELQTENEELKKYIKSLEEKENQLKRFDELVKKARLEYANIASKKDQTAQKLESLDKDKAKLLSELNKISLEIKQLREMKLTEHNQLSTLRDALNNPDLSSEEVSDSSLKSKEIILNEIELAEKRKNDITIETFKLKKSFELINNKIVDGKKVLDKLNEAIEKKKEDLSSLIVKQSSIAYIGNKNIGGNFNNQNAEEIQTGINNFLSEEQEITEKIKLLKTQLEELNSQISEKKIIVNNSTQITEKELSLEIEIKIEGKEAQLKALTDEIKAKVELRDELTAENKKIAEELSSNQKELAKLTERIDIETIRLTDLDYSLNILEDEFERSSKDIAEKISTKEELDFQITEKLNHKIEIEDIIKDLKETTTIIARLKNDIESGNGQSAKRFTGVLQYYSTMINDIYKKKSDLEKVLIQKEKELKEKQLLIDERQAVVEDMNNILFVRHQRSKIIKDLTLEITKQREMLERMSLGFEMVNQNSNAVVNIEISQKKLLEYENALNEILSHKDRYASELMTTKSSLEKEIVDSKNRLNELNKNIRFSTGELSELRNSISKIKIEHEEHRISINKLAAIKTKLDDQIDKNIQVIDKYTKIKDMIREEQQIIKKKRELTASVKDSKKINESEKSFGPHNPKWIKI